MVYVDRRTLCDIIVIGFVLGAIGVLPDVDHWYALIMGWAKARFTHSPLVFLAYAFVWGLAVLAFTARWTLVGKLLQQPLEIGVRQPGYVLSEQGLVPAEVATVQGPSEVGFGEDFCRTCWLRQRVARQVPTVPYLSRSRE